MTSTATSARACILMSGGLHRRPQPTSVRVVVRPITGRRNSDGHDVVDDPASGVSLERDPGTQFFGRYGFTCLGSGCFQQASMLGRERPPAVLPLPDHPARDRQQAGGCRLPAKYPKGAFEGGLDAHEGEY